MNKEDILARYPDVDINEGGGLDNFQEKEPIVERENIAAIIKHPVDEMYLVAKWNNGWCGFLTGGIEIGDSKEDTARKEIPEETGFINIASVQEMSCVSHGLFYHTVKHQNRLAHYNLVFAKLADLEQQDISEEELAIAKFIWVKKEEVEEILTRSEMKKLWKFYQDSLIS